MGTGAWDNILQPATAPTPIANVSSAQPFEFDGRHRQFSFVVPASNGANLDLLVIRRQRAGEADVFYNISCAGELVRPYNSYGTAWWPQLTCTPGDTMVVTVPLPPPNPRDSPPFTPP